MSKKKIRLGVFGFGCVGQGLYHVLEQTKGLEAEIVKICIKNPSKERELPSSYFTTQKEELLNDDKIDVIVELIDDPEAAYHIVKEALQKGKGVVTANKKMVAENFKELIFLQNQYNVPLLYEGSCCASIPIIRNLEEYYDNDLLNGMDGIFNGSTNYILSKIFQENKAFESALKEAQENGFAETDPTLDIEGFDPKYKLCIILAHAFGVFVKPEQIANFGIHKISPHDILFAQEKGLKIKLVSKCRKIGDKVFGFVAPQFVDKDHYLFNVENEFNSVAVEGAFSEHQLFVGKGAGSYPTGSAVLSDISALTYNYRYEYKKHNQNTSLQFSNEISFEVYVSWSNGTKINLDDFEEISEKFSGAKINYLIGRIKLETLRKTEWVRSKDTSLILTPGSKVNFVEEKEDIYDKDFV
ncbi:homoserine dehydrogenase [Xanthovirga aplysinae]|uniref:homoserine dehydrogenase n=1 Tax=Xanthovirga aplysinae TaxID=2529853 RepID=UPI0012BCE316|nr:homoserine dehydrogenase [Xanthovirga aplysinae]MTI32584.1 homoserine dehydrogenase [Xanthovirga aplysinae]